MNLEEVQYSSVLIHNLPNILSKEDVTELLCHFGAIKTSVKQIDSNKKRLVYASFESKSASKAALLRLHQLSILGNRLKVEYSTEDPGIDIDIDTDSSFVTEKNKHCESDKCLQYQEAFLRSLTSWTSVIDLNRPPPSHLRYQYPPPNNRTLKNISDALRKHPRLYTQLLHLMNRMNLPPPFEDDLPNDQATQTEEQLFITDSTEESEYESEPDEGKPTVDTERGVKRPAGKLSPRPKKLPLIKRPRLPQTPAVPTTRITPAIRPEEVFEKLDTSIAQKKIELKLSSNAPVGVSATKAKPSGDVGSFGLIFPSKEPKSTEHEQRVEEKSKSEENDGNVITAEQLAQNRLSAKDLKVLPLFQNYQPGAPSSRLYIKNVAKKVESKDLHFIYRRYLLNTTPEEAEGFDIRLMTEGRMKGQAFVTFPSKEQAQRALQETNGYILKDKPICVQFARSAPSVSIAPGSS